MGARLRLTFAAALALALALEERPARAADDPPVDLDHGAERSAANEAISGRPRSNWGLGPLDVADESVLALAHLALGPASSATLREGTGSVAVRGDLAKTIFDNEVLHTTLDAETVHTTLVARFGVLERLEAALEVPFVYRWEGFLDPLIRTVENRFGNVRGEREHLSDNVYRVRGQTDEGVPFDFGRGGGLAKVELGLKWRPYDGDAYAPAVAVEGIAALPTARPGFGTHGVDLGARLDLSKRLGGDFIVYLGGALLYPDGSVGPIRLEPWQGMGFGAVEFEVEPWLAAIYQIWAESPKTVNLDRARGYLLYQGAGMKAVWGRVFGEFALIENGADVKRSADVIFHAEIGVRF